MSELNQPGAQELLRSAMLARLAYNGRDGFPRVVPIGFHWTGDQIVMWTAPSAPKVAALEVRPEVAITIDTEEVPSRALLVRGLATIEVVEGVPDEYIAASTKAMDETRLEEFEATARGVYEQMARISVAPSWARYYDFGTGRLPAFLRKHAAQN